MSSYISGGNSGAFCDMQGVILHHVKKTKFERVKTSNLVQGERINNDVTTQMCDRMSQNIARTSPLFTAFHSGVRMSSSRNHAHVTAIHASWHATLQMENSDMTKLKSLAVAAAATLTFATAANAANIVEIAAGDDRFSTLVAAVTAADLVETLQGPGPFTVFAPLNDAFAALPEGTVATLLQPDNKDQLTSVLLYHVDDRNLTAEMIPTGSNYFKPILQTERMCITKDDSGVSIADGTGSTANVVIANIKADNGVIHVIDKVLLPGTRPACH